MRTAAILFAILGATLHSALAGVHYVSAQGGNTPPYTNWTTAATSIQPAIDVAIDGDLVIVSNGVYAAGGVVVYGTSTNRVAVTRRITVQSLNGPSSASIVGQGASDGIGAVRCAFVGNGGSLLGFTLTNGATMGGASDYTHDRNGGGVWCDPEAVVSNCIITGNSAAWYAGGAYQGNLFNCIISSNISSYRGGGTWGSIVTDSVVSNNVAYLGAGSCSGTNRHCLMTGNSGSDGPGAYLCYVDHCVISNNVGYTSGVYSWGGGLAHGSARNSLIVNNRTLGLGGGTYLCPLENCVLAGNVAWRGGGTCGGDLRNCTVVSNSASYMSGGVDKGPFIFSTARIDNCIVYNNTVGARSDNYDPVYITVNYCCTTPQAPGQGNLAADPRFVNSLGRDYHLTLGSPCINAGSNAEWMAGATDLGDGPRIQSGTVDIGAYEYPTVVLEVNALPAPHDHPAPLGYGMNDVFVGSVVTNYVTSPADESNGTRYVCAGWTGTGDVTVSGVGTAVVFAISKSSTLTWQWQAEHYLSLAATNGTITGAVAGWKPEGTLCILTPSNAFGYAFDHWEVDGANGGASVPLIVTMDKPKAVDAVFLPTFVDVSFCVTAQVVNWTFSRQSGTFFATLALSNSISSPKGLIQPFWYAVQSNEMQRLMRPTGIEPNSGFPYIDITTQVLNGLQYVGNGDAVLDPGECVTVSGIEFYSRNRAIPQGFLVAVWADPPVAVALPSGTNQNVRWVDIKVNNDVLYLHWIGGSLSTQCLERSEDMLSWHPLYTNVPPMRLTNSVEYWGGTRGFFRIRLMNP